jgi:hypothetical protein
MNGGLSVGLFRKKAVKNIDGAAWGHLLHDHGLNVDTLSREFKCVEQEGQYKGQAVTFLRIFKPGEAEKKGVSVVGWETFDSHPDLVHFEGYVTRMNQASLERKKG